MGVWGIIPVKSLQHSKQRLAHLLTAEQRSALMLRLLRHLLLALADVEAIAGVVVITPDTRVQALAAEMEAEVELEMTIGEGLNEAIARGVARAQREGATGVLVLPADLPFVDSADVATMLNARTNSAEPQMIICTDSRQDGTNGLLLQPSRPFTFHYGVGSFQAHLAEAQRHGYATHLVDPPGLRFDLDTEEDWRQAFSTTI